MNKPSSHSINCDDNATPVPSSSDITQTNTDVIVDTHEDEEIDEYRRRSPCTYSPVTFYIESESSKVSWNETP